MSWELPALGAVRPPSGAALAGPTEHVQLTNMTPLAAPSLAAESEALLGETVSILRAGRT